MSSRDGCLFAYEFKLIAFNIDSCHIFTGFKLVPDDSGKTIMDYANEVQSSDDVVLMIHSLARSGMPGRGRTVAPAVEAPVHEPWYSGIPAVFPSLWCIIYCSLSEESAADFPLPLSPRTANTCGMQVVVRLEWCRRHAKARGTYYRGNVESLVLYLCALHSHALRTHARTHALTQSHICAFGHLHTRAHSGDANGLCCARVPR